MNPTLPRLILLALGLAGITAALGNPASTPVLTLKNLRCEYQENPIGLDASAPRLSWELSSPARGTLQSAYQVRVGLTPAGLGQEAVTWDSGRQETAASNQIPYQGPPLESGRRYHWQVRVWDNLGHASEWSSPAYWETGLLQPADWKARWITPGLPEDHTKSNPAPLLRRTFVVKRPPVQARLYATAQGLYELELNGRRVGQDLLTPGWTSYDFRLQYQTYDVTGQVQPGENCLGAMLGDGWFRGRMVWEKRRNNYGEQVALLAQLVLTYEDGTSEVVGTDEKWQTATGPVLVSDIYEGEVYDARLEREGWSRAGYDAKGWVAVKLSTPPATRLVASGPTVRRADEIVPVKLLRTPAGETVLDMGQNMVGRVRFRLNAPAGTTVTLRHAEVLDKAGNFYVDNLRLADQEIRYTAHGGGPETFEPHFTFQGFRYVAIKGWPGEPALGDFTGVVVHSQLQPTGSFTCSNPLINQLQHNIVWSQKGNFVDLPTDCPQRDERLGWTGDAQVFSPTACFNFDCAAFYTKWLKDLALDQQDDGAVPHVIPDVLSHRTRQGNSAATGWADSALVVPWTVYECYGDRRILEQQYASMKAWVEYMRRAAGPGFIWNKGEHFGDWLTYATDDPGYPGATTDKDLIQTAYFARSTELLRRTALLLGKTAEAADYAALEAGIKAAFLREFVTPEGRLSSNTQTAYALALAFDLLPAGMRPLAANRLAADVRKFGHLTTGFLGTPLLCRTLSETGHLEEAYLLLNRTEYPSWLYPVTKGATTIWERWDGLKPDGTFQTPIMNSFNHYAYGAIGEWLYRVVAGLDLDPARPGYKHLRLQPQPGGGLTSARASLHTIYGPAASGWEIKAGRMILQVEVPANTTATLRLPRARPDQVTESGRPLGKADGITAVQQGDQAATMELGSGSYRFEYAYP